MGIVAVAVSAMLLFGGHEAQGQHPMDVQKLSAEGEHLKALAMYELLPARTMTLDARIAGAKSAWALGLNNQAAETFDVILRDDQISPDTRARLLLSRGVLEYQEGRYQEAALFAEKTISHLPQPSALRGRAFLLWGQTLSRLSAFGTAQDKFQAALEESSAADKPEINYALGSVLMRLGRYGDAERHLKAIPTDHERAAATVRMLAAISIETSQPDRARFWIEKGKSEYSEAFLDSWGDYGLVQIAIAKGELPQARSVLNEAQRQYPPSDPWLILMQSALEQAEWKKEQGGVTP